MGQPFSAIQTIFSRGELSPRIIGRVDNKAYYNAVKYSQNMIPYPQGSITKRPGTYYVKPVKNSANTTILIPFRFSTVQNYMIEAGDLYFRFYRNRGQVESSPGVAYELTTPWPASIVRELYFVQSADTLYVIHPDYQPRVITRTSDTSWSIATFNFIDGPFLPTNVSTVTITPSATTGAITLTASAATFTAGMVGRQVRIKSGTTWGWVTITGFTSTTQVNATVGSTLGGTTATVDWRLSYFGGTNNWPSKATIYEERFVFANSDLYPSTLWASNTGDFTNFAPTNTTGVVSDDNAFTVTIGDDQVNDINWLSSGRVLLIGTTAADHSMSGGTASSYAPVTPTNVTVKREAISGSKEFIRSLRVGSSVFYISPSGLKLKELYYDFGIDNYLSRDATIFNSHMTESGILDMDYQNEPDPTIWAVRNDGQLVGFSYDKLNEVEGWHRHLLGGDDVAVQSVGCIPRPDKSGDDVWLIVSRTINGATVQYVEYMSEYFDENDGQETAFYVDCGLTYNGTQTATLTPGATVGVGVTFTAGSAVFAATDVGNQIRYGMSRALITAFTDSTHVVATIINAFDSVAPIVGGWSIATDNLTGLDHLEGQTVWIYADGAVQPERVVSGGAISLSAFSSVANVGLGYTNYIIMLPVEVPQFGTIQGRIRNIGRIHIYLTSTMLLNYGALGINGQLDFIPTLEMNVSEFDQMPLLQNGIITRNPPSGYNQDSNLILGQTSPTPLTINYVVQELSITG